MLLEREVEMQYRPRMLEELQGKVNCLVESVRYPQPACSQCGQPMRSQDTESVPWIGSFGCLQRAVARYRCPVCKDERRPLLDLLGVEPGRISGSVFFFQAEDGIRDLIVTGVQTCALPI